MALVLLLSRKSIYQSVAVGGKVRLWKNFSVDAHRWSKGKSYGLDQQCPFRSQRWESELSWEYSSQLMSQTILKPLRGFKVDLCAIHYSAQLRSPANVGGVLLKWSRPLAHHLQPWLGICWCPGSCGGREGIRSLHIQKLTLCRVKFPNRTVV